jgi:hypothetical protein
MSTDDDSASSVYASQVAAIIAAEPRPSSWTPAAPMELFVKGRRLIESIDQLEPVEHAQLDRLFRNPDLATALRDGIEDFPINLEAATVVDDAGVLRYRMYAMDFGCIYLMAPEALECVAFAAQHDLEHWHASQRDVFWAMDRAMRRGDHGVQQPMKFCWWEEKCWAEIADKPRGTVQSEPYIRRMLDEPLGD